MGKLKLVKPVELKVLSMIHVDDVLDDNAPNNDESVQYLYEIMKTEDANQVNVELLGKEITVETDNGNGNHYDDENKLDCPSTSRNDKEHRLNELTNNLKEIITKYKITNQASNEIFGALKKYGLNISNNELELEYDVDMQKTLLDIRSDIREIKRFLFVTQNDYDISLPINDKLDETNEKLGKDPAFRMYFKKIVKMYRPTKGKRSNNYGLSKVFTDKLLEQYNWDGSHGRKSFQNLKYINRVLFDAWCGQASFEDFTNYAASIRSQFTTARIRRHKRVSAMTKNKNKG